jgi:hypothetical protein
VKTGNREIMLDEKVPTQSEEITGGNRDSEIDPGI